MNKKIVVSADCVCDLPDSLIKKYSVQIIPFYLSIGEARFQDYTEADLNSIKEYLFSDEEIVSSMPATVEEYKKHFSRLTDNGTKKLVHISVSERLSVAYKNAVEAAKGMENVYVIDSGTVSHGMGLFVLAAASLAKSNATIEIVLEELEKVRNKISCSFIFKTTHYVANNNRLSQMVSNLIEFFHLKPIIKIRNKNMRVSGICFGGRSSYAKKYIRKTLRRRKHISEDIIFIAVDDSSEELKQLVYKEVTGKMNWERVYIQDVSATTYCNLGPGGIGIMFYLKK